MESRALNQTALHAPVMESATLKRADVTVTHPIQVYLATQNVLMDATDTATASQQLVGALRVIAAPAFEVIPVRTSFPALQTALITESVTLEPALATLASLGKIAQQRNLVRVAVAVMDSALTGGATATRALLEKTAPPRNRAR